MGFVVKDLRRVRAIWSERGFFCPFCMYVLWGIVLGNFDLVIKKLL